MIQNITLIFQLLPLVLQTVKAIEDAVPVQGQGQNKADYILGLIQSEVANAPVALIKTIINATVAFFNKTGAFSK